MTGDLVLPPPKTACDLHLALGQIFSDVCSGRMDINVGRTLRTSNKTSTRAREPDSQELAPVWYSFRLLCPVFCFLGTAGETFSGERCR